MPLLSNFKLVWKQRGWGSETDTDKFCNHLIWFICCIFQTPPSRSMPIDQVVGSGFLFACVCGLIFLLCVITSTKAPLHDHWEQSGSLCNAELVADYRSKLLIYASDQAFSIWRATACVLYCSQELVHHCMMLLYYKFSWIKSKL